MIKSKKKLLLKIYMYIYIFFIVYNPRLTDYYLGFRVEYLNIILFFIILVLWSMEHKFKNKQLFINRSVFYLIFGIIMASLYFSIIAFLTNNDPRIIQNLYIIFQIIEVLMINWIMNYIGYSTEEKMKILFNLALLQAIIAIIMLIFPNIRTIALNLYYLGREENHFISRIRIYGLSGDYTFFTPIYHGIIAGFVFYFSLFINKKYFYYVPFILLIIFLNGRTGIFVFILSIVCLFLKNNIDFRILKSIFKLILAMIIIFNLVKIIAPFTYKWIYNGFKESINLLFYKEKTGTYEDLADKMLFFPKGLNLIIGKGHRVYGIYGERKGCTSSDIGYVNDLFMGGLIYVFIQYMTIIKFLRCKVRNNMSQYNNLFSTFIICALLLANYKGEAMRGGIILLGSIFIKIIFMDL